MALYHAMNGANWSKNNTNWLSDKPLGEWYGVATNEAGRVDSLSLYYYNQLSGSIPPELGNLSKLYWLNLGNNQLSGSIPPELGNLANLKWSEFGRESVIGVYPYRTWQPRKS